MMVHPCKPVSTSLQHFLFFESFVIVMNIEVREYLRNRIQDAYLSTCFMFKRNS